MVPLLISSSFSDSITNFQDLEVPRLKRQKLSSQHFQFSFFQRYEVAMDR